MKDKLQPFYILFLIALYLSDTQLGYSFIGNCPASPHPITINNGGEALNIIGKGRMNHNWVETIDGYTIVKNNENIYEYAIKKGTQLLPSGIKARNQNKRNSSTKKKLKQFSPSLSHQKKYTKTEAYTNSFEGVTKKGKKHNENKGASYVAPTSGTIRLLCLLIQYPDLDSTYSTSDFDNMFNQKEYKGTGSFKDYYQISSLGNLNLTVDVKGWYTASKGYEYYGSEKGDERAIELIQEAVDAAEDEGVDFSPYDNNGDGKVDGLIVVHSGPGAEAGSQTQYIWSHRSNLGKHARTYDKVEINPYIINPETTEDLNNKEQIGIGTFCHEFGHLLGLPDLYDIDNSSHGIGEWGLMGGGSWLGDENSPSNFCAWSMVQLGWITPQIITLNGEYLLSPSNDTNRTIYKIEPVLDYDREYFLLENRQQQGLDTALPGHGLAIWHIDETQISRINMDNARENRKLVDMEEADGFAHLDNSDNNRGDAGDLFKNGQSFDENTTPNSNLNIGYPSGIRVRNIRENDTTKDITFTLNTTNVSVQNGDYVGDIYLKTQQEVINFSGYNTIYGSVYIGDYNLSYGSDITNLDALNTIHKIDGDLNVGYVLENNNPQMNPYLTNLQGFSNLATITGSLQIVNQFGLSNLTGLTKLTHIYKSLYIAFNSYDTTDFKGIINLNGIDNLAFVGEQVIIVGNENLTNYCGLRGLVENNGGNTDYIIIKENAKDLLPKDILVECMVSFTPNLSLSEKKINIYPNPTKNYIHIESKTKTIKNVTLYDFIGNKIIDIPNNTTKIKFSMSQFPEGIYMMNIDTSSEKITRKIIKQ